MAQLSKAYEPKEHEAKIYSLWEGSGYFNPDNLPGGRNEPFTIMMPPPNVTGVLHLGHAGGIALEDLMIRFERMRGKKTLWLPGTDHAAVATQTKVEKKLIKESGQSRHDLGREEFLKLVRAFATESHATITGQIRKMGASCDWSREAYTLDEPRSLAVRTVFKKMFDDGLIYRGTRVVNWDVAFQTTLADDEVFTKDVVAKLYTFKYDKNFPFAISTTRPETKFGDTAVAVHPSDERYKEYIGRVFEVNYCGTPLSIKVVADIATDPEFGTGVVGVTPAHSKIDEEIGKRHELPSIQVIDTNGKMTERAGKLVAGLTTLEAREKAVEYLRQNGLLLEEKDVPQALPISQRGETIVEELPMLQWFVDVNKKINGRGKSLKELSIEAVRSGQIEIIPERFQKIYFQWMENLRDWCISRQIWFGHQIPVWYRPAVILSGTKNLDPEMYVG
ncbi:MAG: class I tRNA ligase family protein, partial [bacterium]